MIPPLQPPDSFHLQAAQGWLELGSPADASGELENITPQLRAHPDVLKVQWGILASEKRWEASLQIAADLIQIEPEEPLGWIHRSYALHELKRTQEARDYLLIVVDKFLLSATVRYNLACYECQLGNLVQARKWLETAFRIGDRDQMKRAALEDQDLKLLWPEIQRS